MQPQHVVSGPKPLHLLDNGGVVAVIGARESNAAEYWSHPRCVFMQGDDAVRSGLPANARAVVFTRFLGHAAFKQVMREARARKLTIFPIQGTGELKRTLASLLELAPRLVPKPSTLPVNQETPAMSVAVAPTQPIAVPLPPVPVAPSAKGGASEWVRTHYTEGMTFKELLALATAQGVTYAMAGMSAAYYAEKRVRAGKPYVKKPYVKKAMVATPEPPKPKPTRQKHLVPGSGADWVRRHYTEGMKFADLEAAAVQDGVSFPLGGLRSAFYAEKRVRAGGLRKTGGLRKALIDHPMAPLPVAVDGRPKVEKIAKVAATDAGDNVVWLIDQAISAMQLIREEAVKASSERQKLNEILRLMKQL